MRAGGRGANVELRFLGLYLYDRAGDASRKDKILRGQQLKLAEPLLPLNSGADTEKRVHRVNGSVDMS